MNKRLTLALLALLLLASLGAQNPMMRGGAGRTRQAAVVRDTTASAAKSPTAVTQLKQKLIDWQQLLRDKLYAHRDDVRSGRGLLYALLLTFTYGFLHALGPGHGKMFVVSYFASSRSRWRRGLLSGVVIGMLHAMAALLLVVALQFVFSLPVLRNSDAVSGHIETVSFGVLLLLGLFLLYRAIRPHSHEHDTASFWGLALSVGLVPCPGAVMISLYGLRALHSVPLTVLLVLSMGVGMSLAISLFSLAPTLVRKIEHPLAQSEKLWRGVAIVGALVIIGFASAFFYASL